MYINNNNNIICFLQFSVAKNMLTGSQKLDGVVSVKDGLSPQIKEQLLLCKQFGIQKIVGFINKVKKKQLG